MQVLGVTLIISIVLTLGYMAVALSKEQKNI